MPASTPRRRVQHQGNAELVARYRDKQHALGTSSAADKLVRFLLQLLVATLWRSIRTAAGPLGRVLAWWLWGGKSLLTLVLAVEEAALRAVGWLSGTGFSRSSRVGRWSHYYFGADIKRYHVGVAALVLGGVVTSVMRAVHAQFDERVRKARWLRRLMAAAPTYEEWRSHALQLEQLESEDRKKKGTVPHEEYDRKLLMSKLAHLRAVRATGNPREIMLGLRIDLIRNVANIAKSQKHRQNLVSVPVPIQQYIREVQEQLSAIAMWPESELPLEEKASFFKVTRHAFGRTALLLSGGGGLGTFHLGVCKALFEHKMLPRVLAGSSVGSIVSAVVGTRTDLELRQLFSTLERFDIALFRDSSPMDLIRNVVSRGHLHDISHMIKKLRQLLGDFTFLQAFERTGRMLNVTVCPADTNEPPRLLNYMTAPQVLVWSAVAASSSFPGLYPPQYLLGKDSKGAIMRLHAMAGANGEKLERRWRDGSLEFDLPVQTLAEMFNCNHFLVSQTNPHIVPLVNFKSVFPHKYAAIMEAELKHRLQVVQWLLPEWSVSKYLTLWTQPWEGDVTFTLPSMLYNLRKTIINPTTTDLIQATQVGEHATWERMAAIECNCTIEATLDWCINRLESRITRTGHSVATMGNRVPSWLYMPANAGGGGNGLLHAAAAAAGLNGSNGGTAPGGQSWGDHLADHEASSALVESFGTMPPSYERAVLFNSTSHVHLPPIHTHGYSPAAGGGALVLHFAGGSGGALPVGTPPALAQQQAVAVYRQGQDLDLLAGYAPPLVGPLGAPAPPPPYASPPQIMPRFSTNGIATRLPTIPSPTRTASSQEEDGEDGEEREAEGGVPRRPLLSSTHAHGGFDSASSVAGAEVAPTVSSSAARLAGLQVADPAGLPPRGGATGAPHSLATSGGVTPRRGASHGGGLAALAQGALGALRRSSGHHLLHGLHGHGLLGGAGASASAADVSTLQLGSGGLSRKSSYMRNLHALAHADAHAAAAAPLPTALSVPLSAASSSATSSNTADASHAHQALALPPRAAAAAGSGAPSSCGLSQAGSASSSCSALAALAMGLPVPASTGHSGHSQASGGHGHAASAAGAGGLPRSGLIERGIHAPSDGPVNIDHYVDIASSSGCKVHQLHEQSSFRGGSGGASAPPTAPHLHLHYLDPHAPAGPAGLPQAWEGQPHGPWAASCPVQAATVPSLSAASSASASPGGGGGGSGPADSLAHALLRASVGTLLLRGDGGNGLRSASSLGPGGGATPCAAPAAAAVAPAVVSCLRTSNGGGGDRATPGGWARVSAGGAGGAANDDLARRSSGDVGGACGLGGGCGGGSPPPAGRVHSQPFGGVGGSGASITEEELLRLATCEVPVAGGPGGGGSCADLWGVLLPLAGTCESLADGGQAGEGAGGAGPGPGVAFGEQFVVAGESLVS